MASCNKCGAEIKFVKTGDFKPDGKPKYLVRNMDGSQHVCGKVEPVKDLGPARQGILISVVKSDLKPVSVVIRTEEKGDRTYAVHPTVNLCPDNELPQKINFSVDKTSFATIYSYLGPAELQPTITDFKTAAAIKTETAIDPRLVADEPAPAPETAAPAPAPIPEKDKPKFFSPREKSIILQSTFKALCELSAACGGSMSLDIIWNSTTDITNKILIEAVKE
jgi:hypothetical protein